MSHRRINVVKLIDGENISMSTNILLYRSVKSILDVFNKDEVRQNFLNSFVCIFIFKNKDVSGVKELLAIYHNALDQHKKHKAAGEVKEYPLIVLEGLDGSG